MSISVPFQSCNDGKCDTCHDNKPLDMMVRKNYKKGLYECIDCKVDNEPAKMIDYSKIMKLSDNQNVNIKAKNLKRLIKWAFG